MSNDWKEIESLVHLISKSIEPDSEVEHNVYLPVIGSPSGRTRQCDIVITSGPKHRKTLTLVEVQNRTSRVDINTFNGWLVKLEEVGAQHLVCVSKQDFPESIKEKALQSGNKIKLVTLKELGEDEIPFGLFRMRFKYFNFKITDTKNIDLAFSKSETEELGVYEATKDFLNSNHELNFNEKIFSHDKAELISLYNICQNSIDLPNRDHSGQNTIFFEREKGTPLYLLINEKFIRIQLEVCFSWQNEIIEYPVSILKYEQMNDGSLAWVFEGQNETPSGKISFKIPVIKDEAYYRITGLIASSPMDIELKLYRDGNI